MATQENVVEPSSAFKQKSWADEGKILKEKAERESKAVEESVSEEDMKRLGMMAERQVKMDEAFLHMSEDMESVDKSLKLILGVLEQLLSEMKKANAYAIEGYEPKDVIPFSPAETAASVEPEKKKDLTKPENLGKQEDVAQYYKKRLSEVATRDGTKLTNEELNGMIFAFEQDKIIMKNTKHLAVPVFAAMTRFIEEALGGHYVGGKGAHYLLNYP